jgi:hypothetical protein
MWKKKIICLSALTCAAATAGSWVASQTLSAEAFSTRADAVVWEYRPAALEMASHPEQQLRQRLRDFHREGWAVVSVSEPVPQEDGTVCRTYELRRAKD